MKIAVVEFVGKGGLIHYAYQLCRAMQSEGAEVTLITGRNYELAAMPHPFTLDASLRLWDPKPARDTRFGAVRRARRVARAAIWYREWTRLAGILRRRKFDVVQFGDIRFGTDLVPLAAVRRVAPLLADICHNVRPFSASGEFGKSRLYDRVYERFDTIFVHYATNVAEFARAFPKHAHKVVPIVHGNEEIFRELAGPPRDLRRELGLTGPVVLFFGTLSRYKGLDLLLDAFRDVPGATLVVAGHPHDVHDLGAARVRLVPRYIDSEDVQSWMQLADVIVFPYREIFQSGALHVAQTFGVPIVATRVGAMAEVVKDRETGLLVEPNDRAALAAAINELLRDRALARRLGENAARDAAENYSWRGVARTILDAYERRRRAA